MFTGVRPFDWLMFGIETAVLVLIAYEVQEAIEGLRCLLRFVSTTVSDAIGNTLS
jgi:hypothetical protein